MPTYVKQVDLPYTPQQVFDLVADIENYPRFIPHVASARITQRNGNTVWVDQAVRFKVLNLRFSTRAVLERPTRIRVVCSDSPFGTFVDDWTFGEGPSGGTRLRCSTDFEFRSVILRGTLGAVMGELLMSTMRAFQSRARQLYGSTTIAPAAVSGRSPRSAV